MKLHQFVEELKEFNKYKQRLSEDSVELLTEEKLESIDKSLERRRAEIKRVNQFKDTPVSCLDAIHFSL